MVVVEDKPRGGVVEGAAGGGDVGVEIGDRLALVVFRVVERSGVGDLAREVEEQPAVERVDVERFDLLHFPGETRLALGHFRHVGDRPGEGHLLPEAEEVDVGSPEVLAGIDEFLQALAPRLQGVADRLLPEQREAGHHEIGARLHGRIVDLFDILHGQLAELVGFGGDAELRPEQGVGGEDERRHRAVAVHHRQLEHPQDDERQQQEALEIGRRDQFLEQAQHAQHIGILRARHRHQVGGVLAELAPLRRRQLGQQLRLAALARNAFVVEGEGVDGNLDRAVHLSGAAVVEDADVVDGDAFLAGNAAPQQGIGGRDAFFRLAGQEQAFGDALVDAEHQRVVRVPHAVVEQARSDGEILQCRCVGGGFLGFLAGTEVQRRQGTLLGGVFHQRGALVVVLDNGKAACAEVFVMDRLQQQARDLEMGSLLLVLGDERIGRLLDPVVKELVDGLRQLVAVVGRLFRQHLQLVVAAALGQQQSFLDRRP